MRLLLLLILSLVISAPGAINAGEHPKEHPSTHEHPKKKKRKKKKLKWVKHQATMRAFVQAVEDHVALKSEEDGSFQVYDKKLKKTWKLELDRIHKKRIARLSGNSFFACADFKQVDGKNKLDLDFFVSRKDGTFTVDEVAVHKVNGKKRYTYNKRNKRVPVGKKKRKRFRKKERLKLKEHPKSNEHPKGGNEHPKGNEHPSGSEHPK
jgi:hypothetical protein